MALIRCVKCGQMAFVSLLLATSRRSKDYICGVCGTWHVHYPEPPARCVSCGSPSPLRQDFPKKFVCQECVQNMLETMHEVEKGGVYWTCSGCGAEGTFTADSELAKYFREKHLTFAPDPLGIQIQECPKCMKPKTEATLTQKAAGC